MESNIPSVPKLLIYRDHLLGLSETFIKNQVGQLRRYEPYLAGSKRIQGLSLPDGKVIVVNEGGAFGLVQEALYKKWGVAPRFIKKLQNLGCSLAHVHFGSCATRFLPVWKKLDIPLIVTFHGSDATTTDDDLKKSPWIRNRIYLKRRKELSDKASLFIAVSNFIQDKVISRGFPEEKTVVHYIGVDTDAFLPDPDIKRKPIVLFVGRLVEKKGCEYLIRAMKEVQDKHADAELIIIGDGPLRQSLEKKAAKFLRASHFLGNQSPEQVKTWMNRSKVFSVPSLSEGFGMVFAEAQSMGLPVVSFATDGIPEAVAHEKTGLLAPKQDLRMLAQNIVTLLENEDLWHRFSEEGRQRVCRKFDLRKQTEKLEAIYDDILSNDPVRDL